jgi:hypothetical protein
MAAYMVISSPVSIFEENTPLTGWSMPQAGQAVCDQCHIKADFHVLRDEAAEALHSLRDAFLIGRNDLAQSRASRLNVAAASVGWLCRWRAARVRETVPYAPQRAGGREVQVRLLKEDVAAWSESQTSDQTSGRRTSAERTSASLTLAGLRGSQLRDGELRRGGPQGSTGFRTGGPALGSSGFQNGLSACPSSETRKAEHPSNPWGRATGSAAPPERTGAQVAVRVHIGTWSTLQHCWVRSHGRAGRR